MPKRYKIAALALSAALFALPALADGTKRAPIQGPAPLKPNATQTCPNGYLADGRCYVPRAQKTPSGSTGQRYVESAPTVRRHVVRRAAAAPVHDFSGFTGGVGSNVGSGYYGGGGGLIVIGAPRRFSGVLHHPAARLTFKHTRPKPPRPGGPCGGCR